MSTGTNDGVAQAIAELAGAVHAQTGSIDGKAIGPMDCHGAPITSLSDAVTAVAWGAERIADAIERLANAVTDNLERNDT